MKNYDFKSVEKKWQKKWIEEKPFKAIDFHPTKPKYYMLYEFPNVSGNLHMGHLKGSIPSDAMARFKRFQGYNVLFPMGGDAFGLPAENAAIKYGTNPRKFVKDGFVNITNQFKLLGLSVDWDRSFCTSDEDYYKWTQWIFLQLLKNGKAYKKKGKVNFCPNCKTVLSNEESQNGKCDRCHGDVVQEDRWVWYLKMQEYAEKLLQNIEHIEMAEHLKQAQRHWIGKSEGVNVKFDLTDNDGNKLDDLEIYTTCVETIYGVTFMAIAPEHNLIDKYSKYISNLDDVMEYRRKTALKKEFDRIANVKDKSGCEVKGLKAVNPLTKTVVPIYSADFVLFGHGTGAVMAVPTHDQRDYDFAKMFNIPMIQVIEGDVSEKAVEKGEYLSKNSRLLNSEEFTGLTVKEAKDGITSKLEKMGAGVRKVNYQITDWAFNRQRFWGEPFPVVICDNCGVVALDEKDLPVVLPETDDYMPKEDGSSPLSKVSDWVNCTCPKCGGKAKRETDTMPNWAGSSWYWLRYCDPHNSEKLADYEKLKYWGQVDCYTGGTEHITRHVPYAFFWQNFLFEIGAVPTRDPFKRKLGSGLILDNEGKKMSKSSTNGVNPLDVMAEYGTDVTRLHTQFLGGYEDSTPWTMDGITGIVNFMNKVWNLQDIVKGDEVSDKHIYELNRLIKRVTEDLENLRLNTCISACMIFVNKVREDGFITKEELRKFLVLLNPIAPHITSEIYENVFGVDILTDIWPTYDVNFLVENDIELPIQVNGKLNKVIKVNKDIDKDALFEEVFKQIELPFGKADVKKFIYVPGKIANIIK